MTVDHKQYNKHLYFFLFCFLLIIATVLFIMLNRNNRIFMENLVYLSITIVAIILLLVGSEWFMRLGIDEGLHLGKYREHVIAFFFLLKNYFVVYLFTTLTRILILSLIMLFYYGEEIPKSIFNFLFLTTFILSVKLYSAYVKSGLPQWLHKAQIKMRVSKKPPMSVLEESSYVKDVIKWMDIGSIAFTVLILTNSTYVTYVPIESNSGQDFLKSFEAKLLFLALPFYVLTTYYILDSKRANSN